MTPHADAMVMPAEMTVEIHDGRAALRALGDVDWDELLERSGQRDPTRLLASLTGPASDGVGRPRLIVVRRHGAAVAAMPLLSRREHGLRVVRHFGSLPQCFDPEPPALDDAALSALTSGLLAQRADLLVLEELKATGPLADRLSALTGVQSYDAGHAFEIDLRHPAAGLSKRRRQARSLLRRAERLGSPLSVTYRAPAEDDFERELDELLEFLRMSWVGRKGDAFVTTADGRMRIRTLISVMVQEGRVRLTRVDTHGRLLAFHVAFAWAPEAVLYRTAFDRGFDALSGLGWLSLLAMIDGLAAEGLTTATMGLGGDAYKAHAARACPLVSLRAGISIRGRAYLRLALGTRQVRRRMRDRRVSAGRTRRRVHEDAGTP